MDWTRVVGGCASRGIRDESYDAMPTAPNLLDLRVRHFGPSIKGSRENGFGRSVFWSFVGQSTREFHALRIDAVLSVLRLALPRYLSGVYQTLPNPE